MSSLRCTAAHFRIAPTQSPTDIMRRKNGAIRRARLSISSAGRRTRLHLPLMSLSGKHPEIQCQKPVVLVGMMGTGKTTIGRRLAPRVGLPFFDSDAEIEKAAGMTVSELFEAHGEESFRDGEARVIKRLLEGPPHVLATGGGAVTHPDTRALIKDHTISVWLRADVETLARRATRRDTRPLLRTSDPAATLTRLAKEREPFYAEAHIHADSQPGPHEQTVSLILDKIAAYLGVSRSRKGAGAS